jgi:hypothetical protein
VDAWGTGVTGINMQREEDECPERRSGAIRFSGIYIRAALQSADGSGVYRIQSVEQERGPDQNESGEPSGAEQRSPLGTSV